MDPKLSLFCKPDIDIIELAHISNKVSRALSSLKELPDFPRDLALCIYDYYHSSPEFSTLWDISIKENKKRYQLRRRLKKRISQICSYGEPLFLTLTFSDKTLSKTSPKTRHRYVRDFLNSVTWDGVANIDFGDLHGREHYHAVISNIFGIDLKKWKYGSINVKKILVCNSSFDKLKTYISKLTNHALKDTVIKSRTIFTRKKDIPVIK